MKRKPSITSSDLVTVLSLVLAAIFFVLYLYWWIPQRWEACKKLYDNLPAQLICVSDG